MTLDKMFENGNHPIFFEKGKSNRDIRDNQVDVWMPFENSHKYACTVNKQYAYKTSRKHGYKFSELKKAYSGEEGTIVFPETAPVEAAPVVEEAVIEAAPVVTNEEINPVESNEESNNE